MTWTYDNDPGDTTTANRRDAVRLYIGDTDTNDQQVTDEEIAFFLSLADDDIAYAAIEACRALQAKYARQADKKIGKLSISGSQMSQHYADLAASLQSKVANSGVNIFVGGISIAENDTQAADSDNVSHSFSVGMDDWYQNSSDPDAYLDDDC